MATMGNTASVLPPNGVENDPLKPVLASEKSPVPGQDVPPVLAVPQLPVNGRDVAAGGNTMDWVSLLKTLCKAALISPTPPRCQPTGGLLYGYRANLSFGCRKHPNHRVKHDLRIPSFQSQGLSFQPSKPSPLKSRPSHTGSHLRQRQIPKAHLSHRL